MIVNEGLRKYPPVNVLTRLCTEDFHVPDTNLIIPKGTQVTIPIYSIQSDQDFFPEPDKFKPERFLQENVKNILPFSYLPFGKLSFFFLFKFHF
jgi:cytochrome P450 family 6